MTENKLEEAKNFLNLGVVLNEKGEVLMIRRKEKEIGEDGSVLTWAFPGGKQRFDETREECVEREILAETGYSIRSTRQISLDFHPQFPVIIIYHLCRLISPEQIIEPSEPHEVAEVRWVAPGEIKSLITTILNPKVAEELKIDKQKS